MHDVWCSRFARHVPVSPIARRYAGTCQVLTNQMAGSSIVLSIPRALGLIEYLILSRAGTSNKITCIINSTSANRSEIIE